MWSPPKPGRAARIGEAYRVTFDSARPATRAGRDDSRCGTALRNSWNDRSKWRARRPRRGRIAKDGNPTGMISVRNEYGSHIRMRQDPGRLSASPRDALLGLLLTFPVMTLLSHRRDGFRHECSRAVLLDAFPDERLGRARCRGAGCGGGALLFSGGGFGSMSVVADVTRPDTWRAALGRAHITHIVHGATITPLSAAPCSRPSREPEAENPGRIIDVNAWERWPCSIGHGTLPSFRDSST